MREERALLDGLARGDHDAFATIYNESFATLYRLAVRMIGSGDAAEDVIHDVFCDLWRRRSKLVIHGSIDAYLARAIRNRAVSHLRATRPGGHPMSFGSPEDAESPETTASDDPVERRERVDAVAAAVADLPTRQRQIFLLRWEQQLSIREIARRLTIAPKTAENLYGRALQRVRHTVAERRAV